MNFWKAATSGIFNSFCCSSSDLLSFSPTNIEHTIEGIFHSVDSFKLTMDCLKYNFPCNTNIPLMSFDIQMPDHDYSRLLKFILETNLLKLLK